MSLLKRFSKKAKYGSRRSEFDGYSFQSQLERAVYQLLKAMEQNEELRIEKTQDRILLSDAQIEYRPDFRVFDLKTEKTVWVEAKGFETPEWRIKRRLWIAYGPGDLRIYKGTAAKVRLHEVLRPNE